jgi:putative ABC transport system substrate-binding protein
MRLCLRRREFIAGLGGAAAWPLAARAQLRRRLPMIGVLWLNNLPFPVADFRQGLADQGLVIGENVAIDFEFPIRLAQLPAHAAQLVERRVDVIFAAPFTETVREAKSATTTIPIVFLYGGDPVADGFVGSLGRPSGNVTGMTSQSTELTGKRLGLLHELVPAATTIAFLTNTLPKSPQSSPDRLLAAAQRLALNVLIFEVGNDRQVERAFTDMTEHLVQALLIDNVGLANSSSSTIIELAERHKIPAIYPSIPLARRGGLIRYSTVGPSYRDVAARYVAPILRGAKPSDLPVQQPTKFALVINMRAAKALGLTIPNTLFALADEVIE